ncbi:MAG: AfsR/SARP family transcriptional regulator [Mycobacteriales bacterium]
MGTSTGHGLRLSVLGPLRAWRDGVEVDLGPRQRRVVLGLLLVGAGRRVGVSELVDALWGEDPPPSAANLVHRHVGAIRRLFEPELTARATGRWLARVGEGYRLAEPGDLLDLSRFRAARAAAGALAAADPGAATAAYAGALDLWQGRCCADLRPPDRAALLDVDAEYVAAVRAAAAVALGAGRPVAVLPAARVAARWDPWDERVHADLMDLLTAAGRQREALAVYHELHDRLDRELGVAPGEQLRAAHQRVLLAGATGTPAELPPAVAGFAGRDAELGRLDELADGAAPAVVVSAISGTAGVGKTALAVRWCHRVAGRFPDGQLHLDLRGYSPQPPLTPADALGRLLRALGVPPDEVPRTEEERAARYRSLLAGRRVLVLLDNAASSAQVRPLLPAAAGCLAVVTSRDRLTGLVSRDGARRLDLDVLSPAEAVGLLRGLLAGRAGTADTAAVAELARRCGYLPLALRVAAAELLNHPHRTVADAVTALAAGRLAALSATGDPADPASTVTAVFSWSLRALDPVAARVFVLLGVYPGDDFAAAPVAALTGLDPADAAAALDRLAGQHLVASVAAGRYRLHDLLADYARSRAAAELTGGDRDAALDRLCGWYLELIATHPHPEVLELDRANLVAAVHAAAAADRPASWRLATALRDFFAHRAHWEDWTATHAAALASAERRGDREGRVQMLLGTGSVLQKTGRAAEALDRYRAAERLCAAGDTGHRAYGMAGAGLALMDLGDGAAGLDLLARAREMWRQLGDPAHAFAAAINLCDAYRRLGRFAEADAVLDEAAELAGGFADPGYPAMVLHNRAEILADLGRHADAVAPLRDALVGWRATGERYMLLETLELLAAVHETLGEDDLAAGYRREAASLPRASVSRA